MKKMLANYPRFEKVKRINSLDEFFSNAIFELTYCDRFTLKDAEDKIQNYIELNLPIVSTEEIDSTVNMRLSIDEKKLGGSGFLEILTNYDAFGKQLVDFRYVIRGESNGRNLNEWFDVAHNRQLEIFEKSFTETARKGWE